RSACPTRPVLALHDAYGPPATGVTPPLTATLIPYTAPLRATTSIAAVAGVATFSNLRIDSSGAKTLHFADGALTTTNSGSFTVTPAAASRLAVTTNPAGATAGSTFTTQPLVKIGRASCRDRADHAPTAAPSNKPEPRPL